MRPSRARRHGCRPALHLQRGPAEKPGIKMPVREAAKTCQPFCGRKALTPGPSPAAWERGEWKRRQDGIFLRSLNAADETEQRVYAHPGFEKIGTVMDDLRD